MKFLKSDPAPLTAEDRCAAARLSALSDRAKAAGGDDPFEQAPAEMPEATDPLEVRDILQ
jgi:hypothetical protein